MKIILDIQKMKALGGYNRGIKIKFKVLLANSDWRITCCLYRNCIPKKLMVRLS